MHSSQETDKSTFYGQIYWNKNPFMLSFADSVSTPSVKAVLGPDSLRNLTRGHTNWFFFPNDPSPSSQQATQEEVMSVNVGFPSQTLFLQEKWASTIPASVPAHWVERDMAHYNM